MCTENPFTVYSMFAGIGGIDLGLERTGRFETVAFSEVDEYANRVLAHHWPDVPNFGDCTQIEYDVNPNGTTYIERSDDGEGFWLPPIDVIAAGFPCQDISVAGKQEGIKDGTRSGLWNEVVRAVSILRPEYVILENVAAVVASNNGSDYWTILNDLAALRYDTEWAIVRASDVGAPHQRARWFCIAWMSDTDSATVRQQPQRQRRRSDSRKHQHDREELADTARVGVERHGTGRQQILQSPIAERVSGRARTESRIFRQPRPAGAWDAGIVGPGGRVVEPRIRLLADGIPERVARLRSLGNAVVPQVAQHVGECLLQWHDRR